MNANSVERLRQAQTMIAELRLRRAICQREIKGNALPLSCFQLVNDLEGLNLCQIWNCTTLYAEFEQACQRAEDKLIAVGNKPIHGVSSVCQEKIRQQQKLMEYKKNRFPLDLYESNEVGPDFDMKSENEVTAIN